MAGDPPKRPAEHDDEPYKVGPGKPPREYRWEKGGPSPNPKGRPREPRVWNLLSRMDPAAATFLEYDRQSTGIVDADGSDISNGLSIIKTLRIRAMKSDRASETYLQLKADAEERERKLREKIGIEAMDHIMRYSEAFLRAETTGKMPPRVFPHPADIQFDSSGTVRIVGPVDALGHERMMACVALRDHLISSMLKTYPTPLLPDEAVEEMWRHCRRHIYKLNQSIPPRLKRRIPPKPFREALGKQED